MKSVDDYGKVLTVAQEVNSALNLVKHKIEKIGFARLLLYTQGERECFKKCNDLQCDTWYIVEIIPESEQTEPKTKRKMLTYGRVHSH